jgi:hypothetical protein
MIGTWQGPTLQSARGNVADTQRQTIIGKSPIPTYEQDYTEVAALLAELRGAGVVDIVDHVDQNPAVLEELTAAVRVRTANRAAIEMFDSTRPTTMTASRSRPKGKRFFLQQLARSGMGAPRCATSSPAIPAMRGLQTALCSGPFSNPPKARISRMSQSRLRT